MTYRYNIHKGVERIRTKMQVTLSTFLLGVGGLTIMLLAPLGAKAASTVVVTPTNQQGWHATELTGGATVSYVADNTPGAPLPPGALQLATPSTPTTAHVQYLHDTLTPLSSVNSLSYSTRQISGPAIADPSYQLPICAGGFVGSTCVGFTTLVYEPYQHGSITPNMWQSWDVGSSTFWSSRTVNVDTNCVLAGNQGPPTYSLDSLKTSCPNAVVIQYGVNIGSNNPGYVANTDAFNFNGTVYNFELTNTPSNKDQCKDGGYVNYTDQNGNAFKNQGQCVSWTNGRGQ